MLRSIRFKDFRAFEDTGEIELRDLNIVIGANNAGKTSLLSGIELFLRSMNVKITHTPLAFEEMPAFASFDSVVRRYWSRQAQRPNHFTLKYKWHESDEHSFESQYECSGDPKSDTTIVTSASFHAGRDEVELSRGSRRVGRRLYDLKVNGKETDARDVMFQGTLPFVFGENIPGFASPMNRVRKRARLEIVHPYRPVPRTFYVLDDPNLTQADRELLTFLVTLWNSDEDSPNRIRERLVTSLQTLGLARTFEVFKISKAIGPKVFEIRVAPSIKRQKVTIADAGFGLSQVLPLVAYDARLVNGFLIAYQPEVHLHPFAQSQLAGIFAKSVGRRNQVFVETHSPDLVLGLQSQIARKEIDSKKVRVFCLENQSGRSVVQPVDFDEGGSPTMTWPKGFLDTSLQLARELSIERSKQKK